MKKLDVVDHEKRARNPFPKQEPFIVMNTAFIQAINRDPEITLITRRVLDSLYATCGNNNRIDTTPSDLAEKLDVARPNISRELRKLKAKNILLETDPGEGRVKYLRLSARICWFGDWDKGRVQYFNDPELILITEKPKRKPKSKLKLVAPGADLEVDPRQMPLNVE
jgi:DNA-binding transcriptional ArsR family regulator